MKLPRGTGGKGTLLRGRGLGSGLVALRRAAALGRRSLVRIDGEAVVILPLRKYRRLEQILEREAREEERDRLDVEEAERRLADPTQIPIPFEDALRQLGLDDVSG